MTVVFTSAFGGRTLRTWIASPSIQTSAAGARVSAGCESVSKDVLDLLAAGVSEKDILGDYPYLEPGDIRACLEFAAAQSDHPILPIAKS